MADKIHELYKNKNKEWAKYKEITDKNLESVQSTIQSSKYKCKQYELTIENIKEFAKTARSKSYVKVCSIAYVEGFVKHTGEYNVDLGSDYQVTLTKEQTIVHLKEQLAVQHGILNSFKEQKEQLQWRSEYNLTKADYIPDVSNMPETILSDKGMAFKQGNFFEIIEKDDIPYVKGKRISKLRIKTEGIKLD